MNLSELDGMSVIVRADAGETPSMTQTRAWTFLKAIASANTTSNEVDAREVTEAMAAARRRVCEQYLGCKYADSRTHAVAVEMPAKEPRARARVGGHGNVVRRVPA